MRPHDPGTWAITKQDTLYWCNPGVALLSEPSVDLMVADQFLSTFEGGEFLDYLKDEKIAPGATLCKFAGQLCYLSFGAKRTPNANAHEYFSNIKKQGHGSVMEHANYSFFFYGVSRSFTHELVRHRAGFAYSQVSQRYVDRPRFVLREEYLNDKILHMRFQDRIDSAIRDYMDLADDLERNLPGMDKLSKTERRKAVNQTARSLLPNETEAPIVVTANARAWRHFMEMRGSRHAESEIRRVAIKVLGILQQRDSYLFGDYSVTNGEIVSGFRKV